MATQVTPLAGLLFLSAALAATVTWLVWRERPKSGATAMAVVIAGLSVWGFGQGLVLVTEPLGTNLVGSGITFLGTALVPPGWLVFAHQYTGQGEWVTRRRMSLLAVEPVALVVTCATNGVHGSFWVDPAIVTEAGRTTLSYGWGPAIWLHIVYAFTVAFVANWLLFRKFLASRNVYRKRTFLFMFMSVTILATSAASIVGASPLPNMTLTPTVFLAFSVVALLLISSNQFISSLPLERAFGVLGSQAKSLSPVARDTALEELQSGFLVADHKNRIVDINPAGKRILGRGTDHVVGKQVQSVMPPEAFLADATEFLDAGVTGEYTGIWVETRAGETRCFDVVINPLGTGDGDPVGRVALVTDVTERERRKRKLEDRTAELERQNDQLERFASIVSHDLRNPLNVANGRLELLDATVDIDEPHIEETRNALERMEDIIDDVLTLARLGQPVDETERVDLADVAADAWANVNTHEASFDCHLDTLEVEGSRGRLSQVFENLFRNAVEHGREDVTITVGRLDDGLFVEDDGPGIPEEHRDDVLEKGFTTADDGTGFGLSITDTIVEAHGWDVTVTTGTDGGARFEITNVVPRHEQMA